MDFVRLRFPLYSSIPSPLHTPDFLPRFAPLSVPSTRSVLVRTTLPSDGLLSGLFCCLLIPVISLWVVVPFPLLTHSGRTSVRARLWCRVESSRCSSEALRLERAPPLCLEETHIGKQGGCMSCMSQLRFPVSPVRDGCPWMAVGWFRFHLSHSLWTLLVLTG